MKPIAINNNNGSIQLKFQVNGKRYSLSPIKGGKYGNEKQMNRAAAIAQTIQSDIEAGEFDPTLEKYRDGLAKLATKAKITAAKLETMSKTQALITLPDLWERYMEFKRPSIAHSTYEIDFKRRVAGAIAQMPIINLHHPVAIRDWLVQNKPAAQAKKIFTQLNAAGDWGVEVGLLDENPFAGLSKRIKSPPKSEDEEINPFTVEERDRIIEAFAKSRYYRHYRLLVAFLFFSGCRPSEAIALRISDVKGNRLTFNRGYVEGKLRNRLKTQEKRTITLNPQLLKIVQGAIAAATEGTTPNPNRLLFPSPDGSFINWGNFCARAWRSILNGLPDIEYRNPYQCRHTLITEALRAGASPQDIARHCGNSAAIVFAHYAGAVKSFEMPPL